MSMHNRVTPDAPLLLDGPLPLYVIDAFPLIGRCAPMDEPDPPPLLLLDECDMGTLLPYP